MQSRARSMRRVVSGQQNPNPNSSKIGAGRRKQVVILKKGAASESMTIKDLSKMSKRERTAVHLSSHKHYTKTVVHDD